MDDSVRLRGLAGHDGLALCFVGELARDGRPVVVDVLVGEGDEAQALHDRALLVTLHGARSGSTEAIIGSARDLDGRFLVVREPFAWLPVTSLPRPVPRELLVGLTAELADRLFGFDELDITPFELTPSMVGFDDEGRVVVRGQERFWFEHPQRLGQTERPDHRRLVAQLSELIGWLADEPQDPEHGDPLDQLPLRARLGEPLADLLQACRSSQPPSAGELVGALQDLRHDVVWPVAVREVEAELAPDLLNGQIVPFRDSVLWEATEFHLVPIVEDASEEERSDTPGDDEVPRDLTEAIARALEPAPAVPEDESAPPESASPASPASPAATAPIVPAPPPSPVAEPSTRPRMRLALTALALAVANAVVWSLVGQGGLS